MTRPLKIYLETTTFNYYFDSDRVAHPDTVRLFGEIAAGKYEAYTSKYVIGELEAAKGQKRNRMLNLIREYGIRVFEENDNASRLADVYIRENVVPKDLRMDALHIAISAVNDIDMILSLNFKHIVSKEQNILRGT